MGAGEPESSLPLCSLGAQLSKNLLLKARHVKGGKVPEIKVRDSYRPSVGPS